MIKTTNTGTRSRIGFTLVELMVAMALTIFVMVILTQAFVVSIDLFSGLKGIGDMQDNMRAGTNALRFDLGQNHFEGMRRTSDPGFSTPREGFVRVYQQAISTAEGLDADGMPSARANPTLGNANVLHMACRLRGNQQPSFFSTQVTDPDTIPANNFFALKTFYNLDPTLAAGDATLTVYPSPVNTPGFYRSQWAEVAYFLAVTGTTEEPLNPNGVGTPLFGLYRAQFVTVTDATNINGKISTNFAPGFTGVACLAVGVPNIVFYTPNDFAKGPGTRTFDPTVAPTFRSASLVVPNVLSFQVQSIVSINGTPVNFPVDLDAPGYDSALSPAGTYQGPANPVALQGLSITIRVWDNKTRQTRQITIVQDL